jgi:hypothetical protein
MDHNKKGRLQTTLRNRQQDKGYGLITIRFGVQRVQAGKRIKHLKLYSNDLSGFKNLTGLNNKPSQQCEGFLFKLTSTIFLYIGYKNKKQIDLNRKLWHESI